MKEALVSKGPKVQIVDSPIPRPGAGQVLIKVVFSGSNPKDWKIPQLFEDNPHNSGDDIAGIVEEIGEGVYEFKKGDRVAAFHEMRAPHGSFAEYAIAHDYTTFQIPEKTSFKEASTIPLAAMTSAVGLFHPHRLALPTPLHPATTPIPLIIYGASSATGAFAIKLAQRANIHPILAVAGKGHSYVSTLISPEKGDSIIDYRNGNEAVVTGLKAALEKSGHKEVKFAYDCVSEHNSYQNISQVLAKEGAKISLILPGKDYSAIPKHIEQSITMVGAVHGMGVSDELDKASSQDFGFVYFRLFAKGLRDGWFRGHPSEVVGGGLEGVETGLRNLMEGRASAVKFVFEVGRL